jgi:hypothetical protein
MSFWNIAHGLGRSVFKHLYADGRTTLSRGLKTLGDGIEWVSVQVANWLYENGYTDWSHRVRVLNRYILNTLKVSVYVLSIWRTFETVSRLSIDGQLLDYIE